MGGEMEAIKGKLDEKLDPVPTAVEVIVPVTMVGHGYLYPRKAFQKSVLDKLHDKKECLAFLQAVVGEK